jgi:queuine tRNA-ribosyltransferase
MRSVRFELVAECPHTRARAGILHTPHGPVETPVFMPVGTQGTVKGLTPSQLWDEIGARIILGNTYHLFLRPGHNLVQNFGGLHGFAQWPGALLTDSGGFQVFSLSSLTKISEEGVVFQSHLNGDRHKFTPESVVDVQLALGSDVAMVLDECLAYPATHQDAEKSMLRTVRWARRGFERYRERISEIGPKHALFPIGQGGMFSHLRRACIDQLLELDADGYAIGGLSVGEPRPESMAMAEVSAPLLPADRPRYVMGVGMPEELAAYVAHGVDMMDCVLPSRNARNGCLFTSQGRVMIKQARYREDRAGLDPACTCYTCRTFSRAYLRHLFVAGEILFSVLATLHNITYYLTIMRRVRMAIIGNHFPEMMRQIADESSGQPA